MKTATKQTGEKTVTAKDAFIFFDKDTDFCGEIEARRIVLEGKINGTVYADQGVHLKKGAKIEGAIYTENFSADEGSVCHAEMNLEVPEREIQVKEDGHSELIRWKNLFFLKVTSMLSIF